MDAFVGIDVAFGKRKRLPVCVCSWQDRCLVPLSLSAREAPAPPRGSGNVASLDPVAVAAFAEETAQYLRRLEEHFGVRIRRIGLDAPSDPRTQNLARRQAEIALDRQRISCFTTPTAADFERIRVKVHEHLVGGGLASRLPHANQLWMLVGFALFQRLRAEWECLEVYPQATMRVLGASTVHKGKTGGVSAQLQAVAQYTGWPDASIREPLNALRTAVAAAPHDALDSYASAWVAALDPQERSAFGSPPDDVIWVPRLPVEQQALAASTLDFETPASIPARPPRHEEGAPSAPVRTDGSITLNPSAYRDQFVAEVAAHVADLNNGMNALQAGTYEQHARQRTDARGFTIMYTGTDVAAGVEQRAVERCFRAVMAAFITFLDRMIALQRLQGHTIPIDKDLAADAVIPYVAGYINDRILDVARDRSLTNPKKIDSFAALPEWSKAATKGYFLLRRCLEHHDGIPDADINLQWKGFRIFVGPTEIESMPVYVPKGGVLSAGLRDGGILIPAGTRAKLSEQDLRDLIFTLENVIATEVVQHVMSSATTRASDQSVGRS